ncbi:MAG: enoyl-CoA hydratase-related protein [Azospirillaceae bacterium]|nr:enoyl-CoA hydratase-related protein [Azospirillaceae bacterium]
MSPTPVIESRQDGDVLILTLNAPDRRNAISLEMREALLDALRKASAAPDCRAIVLTGAQGNFSSGGEVKAANGVNPAPDPQRTRRNIAVLQDIVRLLVAGAKPTVAAVEGYAYGAGLSLAAACDYLVASETAKFCASFAKVGLIADAGLMWSLPQRLSPARARDMLLTGRPVEAAEAQAVGLTDQVVPAGEAVSAALAVARTLAQLAPLALASMKGVMSRGGSLEQVLSAEADLQPMLTLSQDYAEGRTAFKERRPPQFRGV